ncbi:uncharacterized protein V1518DRAFT_414592, partial [Limtongia smithiae]|uniref:uncharacterized protein n=1 Tax=Limtongia smithiae TaxID=1125753 RepID=UPI0034CF3E05
MVAHLCCLSLFILRVVSRESCRCARLLSTSDKCRGSCNLRLLLQLKSKRPSVYASSVVPLSLLAMGIYDARSRRLAFEFFEILHHRAGHGQPGPHTDSRDSSCQSHSL